MNFLAHLYLSGNQPKLLVGNFIADFVKGRQALSAFDPEIVKGILLHRAIDEFTDAHPLVQQSKNRLRPKYRHYSGVIVDVFYDHYLARHWDNFHEEILPDFADHSYSILEAHIPIMPKEASWMFPYMVKGNWLVNYAHVEGIHRALSGMSRRTPYESKMDEASLDLKEHYPKFEQEFQEFFPLLKSFAEAYIQAGAANNN